MITTLTQTSTDEIVASLIAHEGNVGASRVLTLLIATDDEHLEEALAAAHAASRDHPSRIVAVVDPADDAERDGTLDAEIRVGHDAGAGETVVLRPYGEVAHHRDTLVVPLLLADVPVVVWWPAGCPEVPSTDQLGRLGSTRITNTPALPDPQQALAALAPVHRAGDIDLAWTRITLWRAMVARALDSILRAGRVISIDVTGEAGNASVALMVEWLRIRLGIPVHRHEVEGIDGLEAIEASVSPESGEGEPEVVSIRRMDADRVVITRPGGREPQVVPMARRESMSILDEELRRLTPDHVYAQVLASFGRTCAVIGQCSCEQVDDCGDSSVDRARAIAERARHLPEPSVLVEDRFDGPDGAASAAAQETVRLLAQAIAERGHAHLVLTGGSAGAALVEHLPEAFTREGCSPSDLESVHLWWGDERFVPTDSSERNDAQIRPLVDAGLREKNIHRIPGSDCVSDCEASAAWLRDELDRVLGPEGVFDVVHVGMGPDAHVCSLFPEHPAALTVGQRVVAVDNSPKPPAQRVSLTFDALASARTVMVVAGGSAKSAAVALGLGSPDPVRAPASCARGTSTVWYVDSAAAPTV